MFGLNSEGFNLDLQKPSGLPLKVYTLLNQSFKQNSNGKATFQSAVTRDSLQFGLAFEINIKLSCPGKKQRLRNKKSFSSGNREQEHISCGSTNVDHIRHLQPDLLLTKIEKDSNIWNLGQPLQMHVMFSKQRKPYSQNWLDKFAEGFVLFLNVVNK